MLRKLFSRFRAPQMELRQEQIIEEPTRFYIDPITPVVAELKAYEVAYAGAEYRTLYALRAPSNGRTMVRYSPTPACREAILRGADLYLEVLTHNKPLQPLLLSAALDLDPTEIAEEYGLTPERGKT